MPSHSSRLPHRVRGALVGGCAVAQALLATGCDQLPALLGGPDASQGRPLPVVHTIGEVGSSPGQFLYPRAMAADGRGWAAAEGEEPHLWVVDKAGRIQRLSVVSGRASIAFRTPEISLGRPCGITVGPSWPGGPGSMARDPGQAGSEPSEKEGQDFAANLDLLYVADTHYHRILVYVPPDRPGLEPKIAAQFGRYGRELGEFIYVTDVAILPGASGLASRLYVGEYGGNDRISIWEPQPGGSVVCIGAFGRPGIAGDELSPDDIVFDRPQSLAIDGERRWLVVTDSGNHRVGVFTFEGKLVRWIDGKREAVLPPADVSAGEGGSITMDRQIADADPSLSARPGMAYPFGLHLLNDGTALITEYGHHRVRHLDLASGQTLGVFGVGGRGEGELLNPWAVTMIGRTVYVLDSGNERIQGFTMPRSRRPERTAGGVGP